MFEFKKKRTFLAQYRDDIYIAIDKNQNEEKISEFIVQKNILSKVEHYVDTLICLQKRKKLLKDLLDLYKADRSYRTKTSVAVDF